MSESFEDKLLAASDAEIERLRAINAELLAALKEMVDCYGSDDGHGPIAIIERARAVTIKAKGEIS